MEQQTKQCTKCNEVKPLDEFSFKSSKDQVRRSRCRHCEVEYSIGYYQKNKTKINRQTLERRWNKFGKPIRSRNPESSSKVCTKCKILKPLDDYYRDKNQSDNRQSHCKECKNLQTTKWRQDNSDHYNEVSRKRNRTAPYVEKTRVRVERWRENHKS